MWFLLQQAVVIPNQSSIGDYFPLPVLLYTSFLSVMACGEKTAVGFRGSGGVKQTTTWKRVR
jgi:hypothetical protein